LPGAATWQPGDILTTAEKPLPAQGRVAVFLILCVSAL